MMNWKTLLELARERSRDMVEARPATASSRRTRWHSPLAEEVFLYGRSAHLIDARVHAQADLRVGATALDLS